MMLMGVFLLCVIMCLANRHLAHQPHHVGVAYMVAYKCLVVLSRMSVLMKALVAETLHLDYT